MKKKYAHIVVGLPLEKIFDYLIPPELTKEVKVGKRVLIPFGNKRMVGYCVGVGKKTESRYTKEIISVLDEEPLFSEKFLSFLDSVAELYFSSAGEIIESALPLSLRKGKRVEQEVLKHNSEIKTGCKKNTFCDKETASCLKDILNSVDKSEYRNFLIHDDYFRPRKFQVFMEISKAALAKGKDVLIIVPEISKIEELLAVFKSAFGHQILSYYGTLSEKERLKRWCLMKEASPKVIIGSRIAVYHPKEAIGAIIVDDEASEFHKQDESPFYNAKEVAIKRANFFKFPLVLYGAPVSVSSCYKTRKQNFTLINLRAPHITGPKIYLADLGEYIKSARYKQFISKPLEFKIAQMLSEGRKIILFLNHRGFSTMVKCLKCGKTIECIRCQQNLTYHYDIKKLVCHKCGYSSDSLDICPYCKSSYLRYRGMGTEKLESELSRIFPQAKISRLDIDIKKNKDEAGKIINDFRDKQIDILIGTTLLIKELKFSGAGLLGIINLEQGINIPDFRGSERLFALLVGLIKLIYSDNGWGELLIQTNNPDSYIIKAFTKLDYDEFYEDEISARKELDFPPYKNLIILNLRGRDKKSVEINAQQFYNIIKGKNRNKNIFISEPIPHPVYKLRDKYRRQIFIKSKNIKAVYKILKESLAHKRRFKGSILTVETELS